MCSYSIQRGAYLQFPLTELDNSTLFKFANLCAYFSDLFPLSSGHVLLRRYICEISTCIILLVLLRVLYDHFSLTLN